MDFSSTLLEFSTILIVEDSPSNLMLLTKILEAQCAQVIAASNGKSALRRAEQDLPDLILLDIHLPDLDGYQICQKLKQDPTLASIPVVFLSGVENAASKVKAFEMGGQDYITKPFHPQEVIVRVKQQLTNQELQRQFIQQNKQLQQEIRDREQIIDELKKAQLEREKTQKALSNYINYVLLLQQITDTIRIQLTPCDIFNATVFQIGKAFDVDRCVLLTYNPNHLNYLPVVAMFQHRPSPSLEDWIIGLKENQYLQTVLSQNQAIICPEQQENACFYQCGMDRNRLDGENSKDIQKTIQNDIQSMVSVRISYQNEPTGVIMLHQCDRVRKWTGQELFRLTAIATHVGIALAQARLLENEKHQRSLLDAKNLQLQNEIHQRKISEQALILQSRELEQAKNTSELANRAKSDFLANMSHELRTPLNAILGFSRVIENTGDLTQEQHDYLSIISRCGNHLLGLINGVLDMAKIESGQVTLSESICDIYQVLSTLDNIFKLRVRDKNISVKFEFDSQIPQYIAIDETKLRQILLNLLDNAVKFTDNGHVILRAFIQVVPQLDHQKILPEILWLQFEVEDTGPGISNDEIELLFQAFVQTDSGKKYNGGTGLGLAISKEFSSLMGGELTVESCLGEGTTFHLRVPAKSANINLHENSEKIIESNLNKKEQSFLVNTTDDNIDVICAMKNMPEYWKKELRMAAITGSDSKMIQLMANISFQFLPLSKILNQWINNFEFEKIINLIEKAEL